MSVKKYSNTIQYIILHLFRIISFIVYLYNNLKFASLIILPDLRLIRQSPFSRPLSQRFSSVKLITP